LLHLGLEELDVWSVLDEQGLNVSVVPDTRVNVFECHRNFRLEREQLLLGNERVIAFLDCLVDQDCVLLGLLELSDDYGSVLFKSSDVVSPEWLHQHRQQSKNFKHLP